MKHKLLAIFLACAMLIAACPAVYATEARDTDFFTSREHSDLNFSEMTYEAVDLEALQAQIDAVLALAEDEANVDAVKDGFLAAAETMGTAFTMYTLADIYYYQNGFDEEIYNRYQEAYSIAIDAQDAVYALARDILASPCAAALDFMTEEDIEYLAEYEEVTEEEKARSEQEISLEDEYNSRAAETYTFEFDGETWDDESAGNEFYYGDLGHEDYLTIVRGIAKNENAALGETYMKLVELRKEIAKAEGYDDYTDYAYENIYARDYTKEEIQSFHAAVKEYIAPLYDQLYDLYYQIQYTDAYHSDYAGDVALDLMDPCVAALSDELYESFTYMREHGLYDSGWSDTKLPAGFTTVLDSYGAPFFFNAPSGGPWDFTTAVHEFGHYNNAYWTDPDWYYGSKSIDIAEVHSQGLELLFSEFYPQIFGDEAEAVKGMLLFNMVRNIIDGALQDELQQFVYATDGVTLQQINEKYCQLCKEYLQIDPEDERTEMYGWVEIPHTFSSPCYYISYAVSAAGAFSFWLDAQENYYGAVDDYLRFTALDMSYEFQDSFAAVGIESPITSAYLQELSLALQDAIGAFYALPFDDVSQDDWFYEAVSFAYENGLFNGTDEHTFDPQGTMTRAMAATALYRLDGEAGVSKMPEDLFTDVKMGQWFTTPIYWAVENGIVEGRGDGTFDPMAPVTRQDLAVMLYRLLQSYGYGFEGAWYFPLDYADADQIADYADEAVHYLTMYGILNGIDGSLYPTAAATRAQVAQMIYGLYNALADM